MTVGIGEVGCGRVRHVKCPITERVKTSLHEGHDANPVAKMSMGINHLGETADERGMYYCSDSVLLLVVLV